MSEDRPKNDAKDDRVNTVVVGSFCFAVGFVLAFNLFKPIGEATVSEKEFQAEKKRMDDEANMRVRAAMFDGVKSGYLSCQRSEPMPVDTIKYEKK